MVKQVDGFAFLKEVDNNTLTTWNSFVDSPFRLFMVKHFEKRIEEQKEAILIGERYVAQPEKLAYAQGKVFGIRLVAEKFFDDIRTEYQRRLDRDADAGPGKSG